MNQGIIGIDPGKNGAIAISDADGVVAFIVMPKIGNVFDIHELNQFFRKLKPEAFHVVIEDVHAIYGSAAGATFNFGFGCGLLQGLLVARDFSYTLIQPKKWQKVMYEGVPEIRKPSILIKKGKRAGQTVKGGLDTKAMSLLAAKRLYPTMSFLATPRCKKPHDGIVDALLIAEYGKRVLI